MQFDWKEEEKKISATGMALKKIFKAMELIATSRIGKARSRARAASPYADAITRAVSAVASQNDIDHVLTTKVENPTSYRSPLAKRQGIREVAREARDWSGAEAWSKQAELVLRGLSAVPSRARNKG